MPDGSRMDDDTRKLEQHYVEIGPALLAFFRRRNSTAGVADDLLHETFLRAWKQRARLQEAVSPRAYLFGIARHVSLDAHRRARPTELLDDQQVGEENPACDDRLELMRSAMEALPETHREPLRLKLQEELSYAEIAHVLGIPVGTVRSRLHHAVQRLHEVLNPTHEPPNQTTTSHEA